MYWVRCIIIIVIVLLVVSFARFLQEEREDTRRSQQQKNKTANTGMKRVKVNLLTGYIRSERLYDVAVEVGAVLLGAFIAMGLTSAYDNSVEQRDLLSVMAVVEQDMSMQAYMLEQSVLSYEADNLDADSLRLNAPIDAALLNTVIHDEYSMRTLRTGAYAYLLQVYRDIEKINAFFESGREATEEYVVLLCDKLINDARFVSEIIHWALDYNHGDINEEEYQAWYDDFKSRLSEYGIIYRMPIAE